MRIATWNINGVKARIDNLLAWLKEASPDVVCLQEIKSVDEGFPADVLSDAGYNSAVLGQKGFNGVALLAKHPIEDVTRGLPDGDDDEQARFIVGLVAPKGGTAVRVASAYMPNGNPIGTEKFTNKLAWLKRLEDWTQSALADEEVLVIGGDYNIIPEPIDAKNPEAWTGDALYQPEIAGRLPPASGAWADRRRPRGRRSRRHLHLLGLSGGCLAEEQRHPHRSPAALAGGCRPAARSRRRPLRARLGEAVRPRAGLGGAQGLTPSHRAVAAGAHSAQ